MLMLFVYLFLAIFCSFCCSILESVLLSTPMSFINMKEVEGHPNAEKFRRLKEDIDRPLAAILTFNTISNTLGAAGVGAEVTKLFGNAYFGVASALLTLVILIFSEILPKTLGATYWRSMAMGITKILRTMIVISFPFVLVSELLAKLIKKGDNDPAISREEVSAMAEMAAEEGEFELSENKLIQNIVRLENVKVEDIMTPQVVVAMEPDTMTVEELYKDKDALHFARIPVYKDDDEDKVTGYVLRQDVMDCIANDQFSTTLKSLQRHIVAVKEGHVITRLWETLIRNKEHIAVVVDEYGSVLGIVTLEDIIETIFGMEIIDETDKVEDMQKYAREEWEKRQKEENMETIEEQIEQEEEKLKESVISQVSSEGGKTEETKTDKESRNNW